MTRLNSGRPVLPPTNNFLASVPISSSVNKAVNSKIPPLSL